MYTCITVYISLYKFVYFKNCITLLLMLLDFLSRIFGKLQQFASKNFFLASSYNGQVVKMCLMVTRTSQIIHIGGSSPPAMYLFVKRECPNRILLYLISSNLDAKGGNTFGPIFLSTKWSLFWFTESHLSWSHFCPFSLI